MDQLIHYDFKKSGCLFRWLITILLLTVINFVSCGKPNSTPRQFIEQQILKLKPESFSDDPVFLQETNLKNNSTVYFFKDTESGLKIPVFIRNGSLDNGKPVVVLQEREDRLRICGNKTTFVVLRQKKDQKQVYSAVIAYVTKASKGQQIEWDSWDDRGFLSDANKAVLFGWTKCSFSSMVPCKSELQSLIPGNAIHPRPMPDNIKPSPAEPHGPDYFCDLGPKGDRDDGKFVGSTIDTMINAMVILSGVQTLYANEDKLLAEVAKDLKSVIPADHVKLTGELYYGNDKNPEARDIASEIGAKKLLDKGREGIASAVLNFDASVSNIGALASGLSMDSILSKTSDLVQDKDKSLREMSNLGKGLLRGLFEGASTEGQDEKFVNPNPKALLKTEVVDDLVSLRKISSDRFLGRLFGFSFWGSTEEEPPKPKPVTGVGVPMNVTIGKVVVPVVAIAGGILFNERFLKGKVRPGPSGNLIFVPANSSVDPGTISRGNIVTPAPVGQSLNSLRQKILSSNAVITGRSKQPLEATPTPVVRPNITGNETKKSAIGYIFYIDNSTDSANPLITYVAPHGFLFYGLFFPGRVVDTNVIEIHGQVFKADPIERVQIRRGLMYPPMPPVYIVKMGQDKVSYFVGTGFVTETYFVEGEEVEGGVGYGEYFYNASLLDQPSGALMPGMAGAYYIEIDSKPYLAYVVNQGVLLAGTFFPAKFMKDGLEIGGTVYPGSYLNYVAVKKQERYKVMAYFDLINTNVSNVFGQSVEGCIEFSQMYFKNSALLKPGEVDTGIVTSSARGINIPSIPKCPPGQNVVLPMGLSTEMAERIMRRDPLAEMLDWKQHVKSGEKSGSKGIDNLASVFTNSFDWNDEKSAGQAFQENLVSGLWTPFGIADDIVDTMGYYTGAGKVSDDYGYIDDLFGTVFSGASAVGGIAGKIVDGVGSVLNPIGLGGMWRSIAGLTSGAMGIIGGIEATKVYGAYDLMKVGAKTVNLGWLLGLRGSESEKKKKELEEKITKLQGVRSYLLAHPPECGPAPGDQGGKYEVDINIQRRKRLAKSEGNSTQPLMIITDTDLFSHVGWRTLFIKQEDLPTFKVNQEEPFVGIGACEHQRLTDKELKEAKGPKELLQFYMRAMGIQCLSSQREALMDLIKFKHILATPQKTFVMSKELGSKKKLTTEETEILSKAFELSTFSKTYVQMLKSKEPQQNSLFLRKFVANYIHQVRSLGRGHNIKLIRNLIRTLGTLFTKSLQDFYRFKYCVKCPEETIRRLMNDPLEIITLLEYVGGSAAFGSGNNSQLERDFGAWLKPRQEEMVKKLQMYLV